MPSYIDVTKTELIEILKSYIQDKSWLELNNWDWIIDNAVVSKEWEDVTFKLSYFDLILHTKDLSYKDALPQMK